MATKEKVYDVLPERVMKIKIERENEDWNKPNFYHNSFNQERLNSIIATLSDLVAERDAIYDESNTYYMFKNCTSGTIIQELTNRLENLSSKELYYYCGFTDINGDAFVRIEH